MIFHIMIMFLYAYAEWMNEWMNEWSNAERTNESINQSINQISIEKLVSW